MLPNHLGRRLTKASEVFALAVQSRNQFEMRNAALELIPVLSQYCDSAVKADIHEMLHVIDALQAAVHAILPVKSEGLMSTRVDLNR